MAKEPAVYIMASRRNGTVYTGVTSNLIQQVWLHREGVVSGFTSWHECKILVWFELHSTMEVAILRETAIKAGKRVQKLAMIEVGNPQWKDLYEALL